MAATVVATPPIQQEAPTRHRVTLEEYQRMAEADVFSSDARIELIDGEMVDMSPIGVRHVACVGVATRILTRQTSDDIMVMVQNPIRVPDDSAPQPDFALVRASYDRRRLPGPPDILLVIEVSDSTVRTDRIVKLPLYAAAGIPEAWIFDLMNDTLQRHTEPGPGGYQQTLSIRRGEHIASKVLPSVEFVADEVLGPPESQD